MKIKGMEHFQNTCRALLAASYNKQFNKKLDMSETFVVWSCKTLQNYKALLSTSVDGDGVYVEYTYNGDKDELYEDFYIKAENTCHRL